MLWSLLLRKRNMALNTALRKSAVWILRPIWRPFQKMVDRRIAPLEEDLRQRLSRLDSQADTIEQALYQRAGTLEGRVDRAEGQLAGVADQMDRTREQLEHAERWINTADGRLHQIEDALQHHRAQLKRLEKGWRHHCPAILDAIARVVILEQDVQFLRKDIRGQHEDSGAAHKYS